MEIVLTKAGMDDIPVLLEIEQSLAGHNIYSPMLDVDEWREELAQSLVFLIKKDGQVVGDTSYNRDGNNSAYITGLALKPEFQGQGIGRAVMGQILSDLKDVKRITLAVHPDNHAALSIYHSLGFTLESRKENYFEDGEPRLILVLDRST